MQYFLSMQFLCFYSSIFAILEYLSCLLQMLLFTQSGSPESIQFTCDLIPDTLSLHMLLVLLFIIPSVQFLSLLFCSPLPNRLFFFPTTSPTLVCLFFSLNFFSAYPFPFWMCLFSLIACVLPTSAFKSSNQANSI